MPPVVAVPGVAFTSGALRAMDRCPRHWEPAVRGRATTFSSRMPLWTWLTLPAGLLMPLVIHAVLRRSLQGEVPECVSCVAGARRIRDRSLLVAANGAVLLVAGAQLDGPWVAVVGLVALFVGLIALTTIPTARTQAFVSRDGAWLEVRTPHPGFRTAVAARRAQVSPPGPPPASPR